jgi:hypothetical protein
MSQNELSERSKRAKIAMTNVFENMHLVFLFIVFYNVLGRQASQESPKTAKKAPKMDPGSLQEPFKKRYTFGPHFYLTMVPKIAPEVVQIWSRNWSQKMVPNMTRH